MAHRLNHLQPLQRLIKEPGGPGRLGPLSYCHQGWAAKVVRAGLEGWGLGWCLRAGAVEVSQGRDLKGKKTPTVSRVAANRG